MALGAAVSRRRRWTASRLSLAFVTLLWCVGCGDGPSGSSGSGGSAATIGAGGTAGEPMGGIGGQGGQGGTPPVTDMVADLLASGAIRGVWGTSPDDLVAVGQDTLLAHFDGNRWRVAESPFGVGHPVTINGVFGFASDDVYAAAGDGFVLHFDGTSWEIVLQTDEVPSFNAVWGSGPNDVYAVGVGGVWRYDGSAWREVDVGFFSGSLVWRAISGTSPDNIVIVGRFGPLDGGAPTFTRFDGLGWSTFFTETSPASPVSGRDEGFESVFVASPTAAFAGGRNGYVATFNGTTLTRLPDAIPPSSTMSALWGTSPTEVFAAVGGELRRLSGSSFVPVTPAAPTLSIQTRYLALHGLAGNELFIAGEGVHYFDGAQWRTRLAGTDLTRDLWASDGDNLLIVDRAPSRFDGDTVAPEDFGGLEIQGRLNATWGTNDNLIAAGSDGSLYLYDGSVWSIMTSNNEVPLNAVWGSAPDNVFAVGEQGTVLRFNGASWGGQSSGTDEFLSGIWGSGPSNVYAVGGNGTILRFDGASWSPVESGTDAFLEDIIGFGAEDLRAIYSGGFLIGNAISWRPEALSIGGVDVRVRAIDLAGEDDLFLWIEGDDDTRAFGYYDRDSWSPLRSTRFSSQVAIAAVGSREVFIAANDQVLHFHLP